MKNTLTMIYRYIIENKILIVILILAAFLRLWKLGSVPPSLTQDEAALGYNAYSILETGRDEYGKFLPIIFKSFGDYKPGLYVYADVPFVATLGLNEVSTRLPSAFAGIISVYLVYLICNKLFQEKFALIAAFVAALNPWLIYYSRGAWETNFSLMFTLGGIYLFLKSFEKRWLILLSSLFFALTLLTYQGAKLSTAIVVLVLVFIYWKDVIKVGKKYIFGSIIVGLVVSLPIVLSFFNGQSGRLRVFSIFSYPRSVDYTQNFLDEGKEKIGDINYYLFHSETLNFVRGILGRYSNCFSGRFLFFEGDYQNPQHSPPYQGMLLIGDLIFFAVGIWGIIKKGAKKETLFIWSWLILSPLSAVLSRDQVNAVRAINMAIPLVIVAAFGLETLAKWLNKRIAEPLAALIIFTFYLFPFTYFLDSYFIHLPAHNSSYWNYGYKQMVKFVASVQNNYKTIKVQQSYNQPYIYFLYYEKYDPAKYQKQANLVGGANSADIGFIQKLDNIKFTQINWSVDKNDENTLLVADPITLPDDKGLLNEIKYLDGRQTAFKIIETK
jgi:4-amino-4-deoxy-L-arabinose transferase-like glycosyltransferase